jgi:hypothetical protein
MLQKYGKKAECKRAVSLRRLILHEAEMFEMYGNKSSKQKDKIGKRDQQSHEKKKSGAARDADGSTRKKGACFFCGLTNHQLGDCTRCNDNEKQRILKVPFPERMAESEARQKKRSAALAANGKKFGGAGGATRNRGGNGSAKKVAAVEEKPDPEAKVDEPVRVVKKATSDAAGNSSAVFSGQLGDLSRGAPV